MVLKAIQSAISGYARVLDVCCGSGVSGQHYLPKGAVCLDIHEPYLKRFMEIRSDLIFIKYDATQIMDVCLEKSFDVVVCIDGMEHLDFSDAEMLRTNLERIAIKRVLIFTPESTAENPITENHPKDTWGIPGGDSYQEHRSGFKREYFISRGYRIQYEHLGAINAYDKTHYNELLYVKDL